MQKLCPKCDRMLAQTEFSRNSSKKDGLNYHCRTCQNRAAAEYYRKNKKYCVTKVVDYHKQMKVENRKRVLDYLVAHPCVDCGESDPVVLEFDHVRGTKKRAISDLMTRTWATLLLEIQKCVVRCANCHRRKTAKEHNHYRAIPHRGRLI